MQLVAGVAGAAIGFVASGGNPLGAQIGFALGSAAFGLFGPKPQGPGPGELKRPQTTLGAQIPRVYGRVRRPVQLVWASAFRATEVEAEGGKGTPEGPSSYTYSLDLLCWLAEGDNVVGVSRIWVNNKLVWTALASSSEESIAASAETTYWDDFTFLPGTAAQVPWPVYEDAVGATDAPAMRGVASIGFENFQCGSSQQLPLIEVEVYTSGAGGGVQVFDYTGADQTYQAGAGQTSARVIEWGGGGAGGEVGAFAAGTAGPGAPGGFTDTTITFPAGSALTVVVGGGGRRDNSGAYGGGGASETSGNTGTLIFRRGGGGGGRSAVRLSGTDLATAGGGGGGGAAVAGGTGGVGGGTSGGDGTESGYGTGGSQVAGGTGGTPTGSFQTVGGDGSQYLGGGGQAAAGSVDAANCVGGGGGGGYYGGGGGGGSNIDGGGGGGGSGYPAADSEAGSLAGGPPGQDSPYWDQYGNAGAVAQNGVNGRVVILSGVSPDPVDLADVVTAELARVPGLEPTDYDVSDLVGVEVVGFTALGPAAVTVADLGDIYHFDLVPGAPMRFVRRASATVGSIAFNDTGAGVGEAGEPFSGLKIGNRDESPGVVGLSYPNVSQDHDVDFQSGDRLTTDGPDVRRVQTNVVLTPAEARARAFSATVIQRAMARTASFGLSDAYAAAEPGDAYLVTDLDGNVANLRIKRLSYADGVKSIDWELNDISALVDELDTETDYTEALTVTPAGTAEWLAFDGPLLRTADDGAGYYAAAKNSGDEPVYFYESPDDSSYANLFQYNADSVFGAVTALAGTLRADGFFCENASITVSVGDGALSSSTRAAVLANRTVNAFAVGVQGRYLLGQFITATLSAPGVYVLSGLLMGQKGSAQYLGDVAVADQFLLLNNNLRRRSQGLADIGVGIYVKAVPQRRAVASVTGEAFTNGGESSVPRSPVQLRIARDAANGDATLTWNRRTRWDTRFGGPLGDACPLGEESERYRVRIFSSSAFTTLVRDLGTVTTAEAAYTGAQQTTDFGSAQSTLYVEVRQISASVGEGHPLQAAA